MLHQRCCFKKKTIKTPLLGDFLMHFKEPDLDRDLDLEDNRIRLQRWISRTRYRYWFETQNAALGEGGSELKKKLNKLAWIKKKLFPSHKNMPRVMPNAMSSLPQDRKRTLVDELIADAEFRKYNKRKYREIIQDKSKTQPRSKFRGGNKKKSRWECSWSSHHIPWHRYRWTVPRQTWHLLQKIWVNSVWRDMPNLFLRAYKWSNE